MVLLTKKTGEGVARIRNIQLLWVYSSKTKPHCGAKPHAHSYYHLFCINKGEFDFTLDDTAYTLHAHDIVIVPRTYLHSYFNHTSSDVLYYEVKFSILNRALAKVLDEHDQWVYHDEFAYQLVEQITSEVFHSNNLRDDSADAALETLLFHLTSRTRCTGEHVQDLIDTTGYNELSRRVVDYLTAHFSESMTLDDISRDIGISKNYLCNAFKRDTGVTILDCLNMIRIRNAARLIVYSDMTLAQVAQECGYVSTSHFNRIFTRYAGIPPGQCRRAYSVESLTGARESYEVGNSMLMYSALAGKRILPQEINRFENTKRQKKK